MYMYMYVYVYIYIPGTPLQYSCLENPMDGGAWWAAVHGVAKSQAYIYICVCIYIYTHIHLKLFQSCPTLCDPVDYSTPGSSVQEYWSGLPSPSLGDLPDSVIKLTSSPFQVDYH